MSDINKVRRRLHNTKRNKTTPEPSQYTRRSAENELFDELSALIPVTLDKAQRFDKISILRLVISYLKSRKTVENAEKSAVGEVIYKQFNGEDPSSPSNSFVPRDVDIHLPEAVVTQLHEQFVTEKDDVDKEEQMQKLESYKEALERGMKDFLFSSFDQSNSDTEESIEENLKGFDELSKDVEIFTAQEAKTNSIVVSSEKPIMSIIPQRDNTQNRIGGELMKKSDVMNEGRLMLKASHGFLLILDKDLSITFVSENVSDLLGHQPTTMLGQSLEDFMYPNDVPELRRHLQDEVFNLGLKNRVVTTRRILHLAMKYSFPQHGRRMRDTGYVLVQWNMNIQLKDNSKNGKKAVTGLVALCEVMKTEENVHHLSDMNCKMFTIHWSLDARILGGDFERLRFMTGHTADQYKESLNNKYYISLSQFDFDSWLPKFLEQGFHTSDYFRIKDASGQWLWFYTYMILLRGKDVNSHEIIMENYLVSEKDIIKYMNAHKVEVLKYYNCSNMSSNLQDFTKSTSKQLRLDVDDVELFQKEDSSKSLTSQSDLTSPATSHSSFEIVNNQRHNTITGKEIFPQAQNEESPQTYIDIESNLLLNFDMENDLLHCDSDHVNELLENFGDSDNLEIFTPNSATHVMDMPGNENLIHMNQQLSSPDCDDLLSDNLNSFGNNLDSKSSPSSSTLSSSSSSSSKNDKNPDNFYDADVGNWIDTLDKFLHQDSEDIDFILSHI